MLRVIPVGGNDLVHAAGVTFGEKEVVEIKFFAGGLAEENIGEECLPLRYEMILFSSFFGDGPGDRFNSNLAARNG
ncbi:MAG: hypothetical protein FJ403_15440 [Verrucomicrobia bacterium]|nr:hypothetical protein [Verrucomicrobiota bacterium]